MYTAKIFRRPRVFTNPHIVETLFSHQRMGYFWFFVRLYVGWQWLSAGWHKLAGASSLGWVREGSADGKILHHGDKLLAFWQHAVQPAKNGMPLIAYPWYRDFVLYLIQHHSQSWFAYLVAGSEFLVGLALTLGAFTAVASLVGASMNFNYMLAGSASINPVLFAAEVLLVLAWKSAGYIGLDRWLLPMLGTPWQPGWLFQPTQKSRPTPAPESTPRSDAQADRRVWRRAVRLERRKHFVWARNKRV